MLKEKWKEGGSRERTGRGCMSAGSKQSKSLYKMGAGKTLTMAKNPDAIKKDVHKSTSIQYIKVKLGMS